MIGWLELSAKDVQALQGDAGIPFREFMKQLLRAHSYGLGIPLGDAISDSENMADGGCDTEIPTAAKSDPMGYLSVPTCWQFKGTDKNSITDAILRKEVHKPYAKKLIESGYGYRLSVADDLTAKKVQEWEAVLADQITKINASAPPPKVVGSTPIAQWASSYPALVLSIRGAKALQTIPAWKASVTSDTKIFVPNQRWDVVQDLVRKHLDFSFDPPEPCMRVRGDAGVGKTRCVFETVNGVEGVHQLCLYTNDEEAVRNFAYDLSNNQQTKVIIVADECLNKTRQQLDEILAGAKDRVRVIVINNTEEPSRAEGPEPIVHKLQNEVMDKILEQNFPAVPVEIRRAAIDLAEGFVRIAADLCKHGVDRGIQELGSYVDFRLPEGARRTAVDAMSLFERVGWRDDVANQLAAVAEIIGTKEQELRDACLAVKEASPGFVVLGGRYFYVTPEAIARVCFPRAWEKWVAPDPRGFYNRLPEALADSFQLRVRKSAPLEIRDAFAKTLEDAVNTLTPQDLGDKKKAEELIRLVETHPSKFLPLLRALVESAPDEVLWRKDPRLDGWGVRRKLVWMCEHLAAFPEYFYDVERILLRLATHETELEISNNASEIWQQLFRIHLSGTAVPFSQRLGLLRKRFESDGTAIALLVLRSLESVFSRSLTRMGGPAVVAGRIPPAEWEPQTGPEQAACYNDALALLVRGLTDDREPVRERAAELLVDNLRFLLADRWFEVAQIVGERNDVRSAFLPRILDQIDDFIRYDSERWDEQYISAVKLWRESLVPRGDRLAQLRAIVGQSRKWGEDPNAEQELQRLIVDLARQLVDDQSFFEKSLDWLSSKEANYAFEVGEQLGRLDLDLRLFQRIKAKAQRDDASLVRGYIFGAVEQHHSLPSSIADWLGELEADEPQLLYRIASSIPTQVQGLDRVLRLVAAGKLPPRFLNGMQYRFGGEGLSIQQLVDVLGVLSSYEGKDREEALITAIDIAASQVNKRNIQHQGETVLNDQVWPLIRSVVANAMPKATMDVFHWSSLMRAIEAKDPLLVTSKAVQALAEGIYTGERATEILLQVAKNSSELVMTQLGKALLNEKTGWRLQIHGFGALLSNLPVEVVLAWLDRHGVIAARKIASNLPVPFVSDSGEPILPPLTERVLKRYGDDEEVRQRFISRSGVRSYSGDIVGQHLREADVAAQFLNHPLEPIRYWARVEQQRSLGEAARWKQHVEEERW